MYCQTVMIGRNSLSYTVTTHTLQLFEYGRFLNRCNGKKSHELLIEVTQVITGTLLQTVAFYISYNLILYENRLQSLHRISPLKRILRKNT